ncbi:ADP-ribosylglycohydrolase family protein [candidate division KSB1 bacterium]|nr:ADP-ribosylglycohydrolase family protein [candidate division KSB1 bacterium]
MECKFELALNYYDEIQALVEQGYDGTRLFQWYHYYQLHPDAVSRGVLETALTQILATFDNDEPSTLAAIQQARPGAARFTPDPNLTPSGLQNKIAGGWLGRIAGCMLGKPLEGFMQQNFVQNMRMLRAANLLLPENYLTPEQFQTLLEVAGQPLPAWFHAQSDLFRPNIRYAVQDDDLDYPILGLHLLKTWGEEITPAKIGAEWLLRLPYHRVYTAERVAYRNLVLGIPPPQTATFWNPYREWIGAQIRGDIFGWTCPGDPGKAAALAFQDAALSHVKNGIYGEMWVAAMLAAAFHTTDIEQLILQGLAQIPAHSRLAQVIQEVLQIAPQHGAAWEKTLAYIWEKWGHYHPVHTINNAAVVAAALLHAPDDFSRAIGIAVAGGWDTDCNGATVGSIMGVRLGAANIPDYWTRPFNDHLKSYVQNYAEVSISWLISETFALAQTRLKR